MNCVTEGYIICNELKAMFFCIWLPGFCGICRSSVTVDVAQSFISENKYHIVMPHFVNRKLYIFINLTATTTQKIPAVIKPKVIQ